MAEDNGWVSLHRTFLIWEWYTDINTKSLFLHLLLKANHKDNRWRGKLISRGQTFVSIKNLANDLGLTEKQIRNSIKKLIKTGEITKQGANNGTLITLCNYNTYQDSNYEKVKPKGKQRATKGQSDGNQRATNNKDNKDNKDNKKNFRDKVFTEQNKNDYGYEVLSDFYNYWSETKENGVKMLYQMKPTFNIGLRLKTWIKKDFDGTYKNHLEEKKVKARTKSQKMEEDSFAEVEGFDGFANDLKGKLVNKMKIN